MILTIFFMSLTPFLRLFTPFLDTVLMIFSMLSTLLKAAVTKLLMGDDIDLGLAVCLFTFFPTYMGSSAFGTPTSTGFYVITH